MCFNSVPDISFMLSAAGDSGGIAPQGAQVRGDKMCYMTKTPDGTLMVIDCKKTITLPCSSHAFHSQFISHVRRGVGPNVRSRHRPDVAAAEHVHVHGRLQQQVRLRQ